MKRVNLLLLILLLFSCKNNEKDNGISDKGVVEIQEVDTVINISKVKTNLLLNFEELLKINNLNNSYRVSNKLLPNYLEADFDGNGIQDVVFVIEESKSDKIGLVFFHSNYSYFIVGAGVTFNKNWDNMNWLGVLKLDNTRMQHETVFDKETFDIIGDKSVEIPNIGVVIREEEGSGGLLYFSDNKYKYLHQGS